MQVKIQKWGNSLAIRIPSIFVKEIKLNNGSNIDLTLVDGKIIAKPIEENNYSLDQLLKDVTNENIHSEIDTGKSLGKEIW